MSLVVIRTETISPANPIVGGNEQREFSQALGDELLHAGRSTDVVRILRWLDTPSALVISPDRTGALASEIRAVLTAKFGATTPFTAGQDTSLTEFQLLLDFIDGASSRSMYVLMNVGVIP